MTHDTTLPLIALRDVVLFPGMIAPIYVGRVKSVKAIDKAKEENWPIYLVTQTNPSDEDPKIQDLYKIGLMGKLTQVIKLPNNHLKILVDITHRVSLSNPSFNGTYLEASGKILQDEEIIDLDDLAIKANELVANFSEYVGMNKRLNPEILNAFADQKNPAHITHLISSHIACKLADKQDLLETSDVSARVDKLDELIAREICSVQAEQAVNMRVKKQIEKSQRDYYLNEQMKAIQKEIGDSDSSEHGEFEKKIKTLALSKDAKEKAEAELKKLKTMNPMTSESGVIRNYLDILLGLPWGVLDKSKLDVAKAEKILDKDHHGLEKVKERILEYLSVLQRSKKIKGTIICLVGPPGVGKTSLVKSIAEAMGRKYIKLSLGGVKDESEIRGHRRTYLGSMPGKIINLIKKSKTSNPVMLLDEIDKMSSDFRGDPASAMLEVLDPEQNANFADHYLEVEYDLSNVVFIATANSLEMPRPLLDRLEIIRVSGYIEDEKIHIAKEHLLPKILQNHNIKAFEFSIEDAAMLDVIRYYTKESGVRSLERELSKLARKSLRKILSHKNITSINITSADLEEYLGVRKFKFGEAELEDQVGLTTGLAYTEVGGETLSIEAVLVPGKGEIKTTGKLGEVMKESTQAAFSYLRSEAESLSINIEKLKDHDIHIHFPEGAVPKDGPSAGIGIFTTLSSLLLDIPVKKEVGMTGEITLKGKVLPIGGLKEKLLAAVRAGLTRVLIPSENIKDLRDIPDSIKDAIEIIPVSKASEVLPLALARAIEKRLDSSNTQEIPGIIHKSENDQYSTII
ncbi:MAG: endopeptidase La [Alphaproteobacteria bacterium]|nr:endopeptidase La [Alphaproteobacteria bacterium]